MSLFSGIFTGLFQDVATIHSGFLFFLSFDMEALSCPLSDVFFLSIDTRPPFLVIERSDPMFFSD